MTRRRATPVPVPLLVVVLLLMAANSMGRGIYERANASSGPMS